MGLVYSLYTESLPPKSKFLTKDIPDLTGKVVIVTGANTGIGKETAEALLEHKAKVYIAVRSPEKAAQVITELKEQTGKDGLFLLNVNLADLNSIKAAAADFNGKEKELHILFNNAGVMSSPIDHLSVQGYDLQFGTNVLGHFYLTKLLLSALIAGGKSSPDGSARVVSTSSSVSLFADTINFNTLKDTEARKKTYTQKLYWQSKLGNVLFANELARRYGEQGIVSTSLNPGNIHTPLQRHLSVIERQFLRLITYKASDGALTQLWAGTSPEGVNLNGKYLIPWARIGTGNKAGQDPVLARELWQWLEEQVEGL